MIKIALDMMGGDNAPSSNIYGAIDFLNQVPNKVKIYMVGDENQISKLIGTTKDTIEKIRTRSHWNISNITAKHPVLLSLCSQEDLDEAIIKSGGSIDVQSDESSSTNN